MVRTSTWLIAVTAAFLMVSKAQRLYPCESFGYHDVVENTSATFYCDQYSGTVEWRYKGPNSQISVRQSTCYATHCTPAFFNAFTATFISAGNSSFTTTLTSRDLANAGGEYSCKPPACKVHIIVPAKISKPTSTITRTDQGYSAQYTTNVTKVYSSRGLYSCVLQIGPKTHNVKPNLQPSPGDTNNTSDRTGSCDITLPLTSNSSTYTCAATVSPGNTQSSSDSIQIARPPPPEWNCPSDPVPENSNISCTCHTDNIGQPGGRLRWYTGTGNNVDREVISGAYDASSVAMTWPVTRSDDNVRKFRCVNNWAVNVTSGNGFTVSVAYRTKIKAFNLNNMATHLTVNESDVTSVNLTCRSDGRPTPRMQLVRTRDGSVLKTVNGGSYTDVDDDTVVDHVISPARCEDTGTYMCVSDNQLGPEERQALSLFVNCVPRRADLPTVDYEGRPVHLSVNMVAFPLPETFTFVFHGPGNNLSEPVTSGILDMHCKNMLAAYIAICNITVNTMTSTDAGFYSVRIGNSVGNSTVTFEVKYFDEDPQAGESSSGGLSAGAAVGVTLAVVFVVVGFVVGFAVVWIWRRHWVLPCASPANGSSNTEYNQAAVSPPVSVEPKDQQNARANEMPDDGQQPSNQYDILQLQDIGVRSDYAELSHYVNSGMKSASRTGKKQ